MLFLKSTLSFAEDFLKVVSYLFLKVSYCFLKNLQVS